MFLKTIWYSINAVRIEHANDKYNKTQKNFYRDKAIALSAQNELIKSKVASPKNTTFNTKLKLGK